MFTLKLYGVEGSARRIVEAHELHINMARAGGYEITAYVRPDSNEATRYDVGPTGSVDPDGGRWDYAYIENAAGKTTEKLFPVPALPVDVNAITEDPFDRHGFRMGVRDQNLEPVA